MTKKEEIPEEALIIEHAKNRDDTNTFIPPEGMVITEGDTLEDTTDIVETLLTTEWVEEARQVPREDLQPLELAIIDKCINGEEFTQLEKDLLQQILARYRQAIREQKPDETIQQLEENMQLVNDEKELIRLYEEFQEEQSLLVNLTIGQRKVLVKLFITPINNSKAVLDINQNLGIYSDLTEKEARVYEEYNQGQAMTREDEILALNVKKRVDKIMEREQDRIVIEFLAMQTKLNNNSTYESMKEFWEHVPVLERTLIFSRVQEMTNLNDVNIERLFPEPGN